jgi:radical SAM protein with 4Fe4S-binding SPASM domain
MSYRYFFLNSESILVNGRQTAAIYDFTKEDIIGLEPEMAAVLQLAEAGFTIEQIAFSLTKEINSVKSIFNRVEMLGLGQFYDRRFFIEKSKEGKLPRGLNTIRTPIITRLFVELPAECGLGCTFCQAPKLNHCAMCSMPITAVAHKDRGALYSFLEKILKVQCMSLIFRGGDPLAQRVEFFEVVKFCRELGFKGQIFVITNGTAIDGVSIAFMQSYGVHPVIPFTGDNSGLISNRMLRKLVQTLERGHIKFALTLLISSEKAENAEFLRKWAKQLGAVDVHQVILMDVPAIVDTNTLKDFGKQVSRISAPLFYHNAEFHPCLHGTLAVSADGMLMPCPFLSVESLGTISDPSIIDKVFETEIIDRYWQISLSKIEGCRECAFRYGCLDCRAVERVLTGSIYDKKICSLKNSLSEVPT